MNFMTIKLFKCGKKTEPTQQLIDISTFWNDGDVNISDKNNATMKRSMNFEFGNIIQLAPHFREKSVKTKLIKPRLVISKKRKAKIAIGIPTVKREESYLFRTLNSLIKSCTQDELKSILIVVLVSEVSDIQ